MTTKRLALLAVLFWLAIVGCDKRLNDKPNPSSKVRLGYMPFASDLAIFWATEKGYFSAEGLDVQLIQFKAANENLNALLADRIDATGMLGFPTIFSAFEKDEGQFRAFLGTAETEEHWASAILVPLDSPIKRIEDLKGKVVGTYTGTTQLLNLRSILQRFMDPEKDVTIREVQSDLQLPALQSKQFDALFTIEPQVTIALEKGIGKILVENPRYKYILKPFPVTANCVSMKFLQSNPQSARAVYRALAKAAADIRQMEAEAKKVLPKYTPLSDSSVEKSHLYFWWISEDVDYGAIQSLADLFQKQGLLNTKIDVNKMFGARLNE